ncbi:MAG TPA: RNA-binding cell elongation regulator Jag/EloR [Candidatus Saccharimonadales bacterium]|nr:RNA-binding cell elongation regulator Jag/EloR [Candidatus Saccharimonadales bacterium]
MPLRGEEFTGRTVEEAIERGLLELGRKRSDVDIEILERGKPANMLGMGGVDARVLLSFTEEERALEPEPVIDEREVPRRPDAVRAAAERAADRAADEAEASTPLLAEDLALGRTVLVSLLEKMDVEADVTVDDRPGMQGLEVEGAELGALIGRGGENLVALQQIVSAITSKSVGHTVHVPVDVEGYRKRREDQLREVARRVASRVKTTGQAVTLEPMLAYERRIVHLAVQEQPGIKTESVGMDPNRRVVISSTAPGARGPIAFRPPRPGGFRSGPRPGGPGGPGGFAGRRPYPPRPGGVRPPRPGGFGPGQ